MQPLGGDKEPPEIQDLSEFWETCEDTLHTVDPDLDLDTLQPAAIRSLGPHLLGRKAWRLVKDAVPETWDEFKEAVEEEFGISKSFVES